MNYINTLSGYESLGALPPEITATIKQNHDKISSALQRAKNRRMGNLGKVNEITHKKVLIDIDDAMQRYNGGISEDEIIAWVWYRRSIGIPMKGWEKYYIKPKKSQNTTSDDLLVTNKATMIKSIRDWGDLMMVPKGSILGKHIKKGYTHQSNDGKNYCFFRDNEGIKIVCVDDVITSDQNNATDREELDRLVKVGALFYFDGELLPYAVYTYNNSYDLELQLRKDKDYIINNYGEKVYLQHEETIKRTRPQKLSILMPDVKDRPQIAVFSQFARDFIISELRDGAGLTLDKPTSLRSAFVTWLYSLSRGEFEDSNAYEIINYYIKGNRITDKELTKSDKIAMRSRARNEGERLFAKFLHEVLTIEDQQKLDVLWNRLYNGYPNVSYNKIPIAFSSSATFKGFDYELRPAQREGIAFMELMGSGIISFDVGVGKTLTAISELANAIQCGKCQCPLVVVPKQVYGNWIAEMFGKDGNNGILTGTDIKLNDWGNLGRDSNFTPKQSVVKSGTITLVTYEGFNKIGFNIATAQELLQELIDTLQNDEIEADETERERAKRYERYFEMIGLGNKDTVLDIERAGFDYIVIDEAHNFKNVFKIVKKSDDEKTRRFKQEIGNTSNRGIKAYFLNNYIQRKFGRNTMLLTATPFTNSPLEIYSMLSHVALKSLKEQGYSNIYEFFVQFVNETTEETVNAAGDLQEKDVIKSFRNREILQRIIYTHINYKTGEEAGVKRPSKINLPRVNVLENGVMRRLPKDKQILTYLTMTTRQKENQSKLLAPIRVKYVDEKNIETGKGEVRSGGIASGEVFRALNNSLNNAFSPFLYDRLPVDDYKEFVTESPKIHYACECIRSVKKWHEKRGEECSGQIIYSDRGKDYFPYIKEYLDKEIGFKTGIKYGRKTLDEVMIMSGGISDEKKDLLIDAFNEGIIKVMIGTSVLKEGVNLQKRSTCLYNLYPEWNPTDIRQLEGRIWRQGNQYEYVRVVMPLVEDSMDTFVFQKLDEKTSRVNDIWYRGTRGNVLDLESLDPEEIKYALMTDIRTIAASIIKKEVYKQEREISNIQYNINTLSDYNQTVQQLNYYRDEVLKHIQRFVAKYESFGLSRAIETNNIKKTEEPLATLRKYAVRYREYLDIAARTPRTDKDILLMFRKLYDNDLFGSWVEGDYNLMKERLSKSTKIFKSVIQPKGYTEDTDIEKVIEDYQRDLDKANAELDRIKSEEHFDEVAAEVQQKKEGMQVDGASLSQRVGEFAKLNYLMSYPFTGTSSRNIPQSDYSNNSTNELSPLLLAEAKLAMRKGGLKGLGATKHQVSPDYSCFVFHNFLAAHEKWSKFTCKYVLEQNNFLNIEVVKPRAYYWGHIICDYKYTIGNFAKNLHILLESKFKDETVINDYYKGDIPRFTSVNEQIIVQFPNREEEQSIFERIVPYFFTLLTGGATNPDVLSNQQWSYNAFRSTFDYDDYDLVEFTPKKLPNLTSQLLMSEAKLAVQYGLKGLDGDADTEVSEFMLDSSAYDSKHINNLAPDKKIPYSVIENLNKVGMTLENIDHLTSEGFPVCKYKTQVTVHGICPELKHEYIGGYKCLTVNQNQSLGIRWVGIDTDKKKRIGAIANKIAYVKEKDGNNIATYHYYRDSTVTSLRLVICKVSYKGWIPYVPDKAKEIAEEFIKTVNDATKGLFFGYAHTITTKETFFKPALYCVDIVILGIYEKQIETFIRKVYGLSESEYKAKLARYDELEAQYQEQRRQEEEESKRQEAEKEKSLQESLPKFKEEYDKYCALFAQQHPIPDGFIKCNPQDKPKSGDIICFYIYPSNRSFIKDDKYVFDSSVFEREAELVFKTFYSSFGKMCYRRCDENGVVDKTDYRSGGREYSGGFQPYWYVKAKSAKPTVKSTTKTTTTPTDFNGSLQIVDYSDKAIVLTGDTKPIKDEIKALGGKFGSRFDTSKVPSGIGWLFPKTKLAAVQELVSKYSGSASPASSAISQLLLTEAKLAAL